MDALIQEIARRWTGSFHNHRQVMASEARGGSPAPELTRERREMDVHRLDAPQLGDTVLYFQEFRASQPGLAHRQRVMSLVVDHQLQCVRAEQLFFRDGPTYDRPPLEACVVAAMPEEAFRRYPNCDLLFSEELELDRYRGRMQPRACVYPHPIDGEVYAEFEMLLYPDQLWYRDRSLRLADGTVRGEVDGFSWLLFDRTSSPALVPALLKQQGVWQGIFRRFDALGNLQEAFPTEIIVRVLGEGHQLRYHQTNIYRPEKGPIHTIEAFGEIRDGRVWFSSDRYDGWAMDLPEDAPARGCLIVMRSRDGANPDVHEIVSLSEDGRRRCRSTQFLKEGRLVGRTLIDEEKLSDDWRARDSDWAMP